MQPDVHQQRAEVSLNFNFFPFYYLTTGLKTSFFEKNFGGKVYLYFFDLLIASLINLYFIDCIEKSLSNRNRGVREYEGLKQNRGPSKHTDNMLVRRFFG